MPAAYGSVASVWTRAVRVVYFKSGKDLKAMITRLPSLSGTTEPVPSHDPSAPPFPVKVGSAADDEDSRLLDAHAHYPDQDPRSSVDDQAR